MIEATLKSLFASLLNANLIGYVAFGVLLVYTFKKNDERESRYINLIDRLTKKLNVVDAIKYSIEKIEKAMEDKKNGR